MNGVRHWRIGVLLALLCFGGILLPQDPAEPPASLEDQLKEELRQTFGAVAIMDVTHTDLKELRIKTGLPVISDEAYRRVLVEVCALVVTKEDAAYEAVRIVNSIEKQGFVFQAAAECETLIGKSEKEGKEFIFLNTEFCQGRC